MSQEIKSPEEFAENLELLLQALVENTQSTDVNLERLKNESMNHKEDLARLLKVVVDGNGQPPILTRLAVIENKIEDIEIVRDNKGVAHIFGSSNDDVYFGLGFSHAQDRLWQMMLTRRTAQGRLSEIFGEETVKSDEFIRRLGI